MLLSTILKKSYTVPILKPALSSPLDFRLSKHALQSGGFDLTSLTKFLSAVLFFSAVSASAQSFPAGAFKHIIIVIQENRTPDNLFGASPAQPCNSEAQFEPGVDIQRGGYGFVYTKSGKIQRQLVCNASTPLSGWYQNLTPPQPVDPDHSFKGVSYDYDNGAMDGFCHEYNNSKFVGVCPSYAYVQRSDVQPYFDIATNYGFANYMFQTNQGASFAAHQFLFTGTSAPVEPHDPNGYYLDFASENVGFNDSGCPYTGPQWPQWVLPNGTLLADPRQSECYTHDSLVTAAANCATNHCDRGIVSWAYYNSQVLSTVIWDATVAIPQVCYGALSGTGPCAGPEWTNHVRIPKQGYSDAPIFDDLFNCKLPQVSWVVPQGTWSDHPQDAVQGPTTVYGPSWVGDIVDAVGGGMTGSTCNPPSTTNARYWTHEPTLILVVWDDWGGFFDHVPPPNMYRSTSSTSCPTTVQPNGWGCGYTYGLRVPFLVVSPYTKAGYVSGSCQTNCPNMIFPYIHDFGSILAFTEYNFGMPYIDAADKGYADYNAPDNQKGNVPLSDFFSLSNKRSFTNITTSEPFTFFQNYHAITGAEPEPPDND
jgi:phospholipase C